MTDRVTVYFEQDRGVLGQPLDYEKFMDFGRVFDRLGITDARYQTGSLPYTTGFSFASEADAAAFRLACSFETWDWAETCRRRREMLEKAEADYLKGWMPRGGLSNLFAAFGIPNLFPEPPKRSWLRKVWDWGRGR